MLYLQPTLWCPLQFTRLCFMDPEPFRKFLSGSHEFAKWAELFTAVVLLGPTQDFILFCMELRGNRKTRSALVEFSFEHAKQ